MTTCSRTILYTVGISLILLCNAPSLSQSPDDPSVTQEPATSAMETQYFLAEAFASDTSMSDGIRKGLSTYLQSVKEPPLSHFGQQNTWCYRLVLRSASGRSLVLRLSDATDGAGVLVTKLSDHGNSGLLAYEQSRPVSASAIQHFLELLDASEFWWTQTAEPDSEEKRVTDGQTFLLEGVNHSRYHAVFRRNPKPSAITKAVEYLVDDIGGGWPRVPFSGIPDKH